MSLDEPLPLDDVLAIVGERARRRQRRALRAALGTGAAGAAVLAVALADRPAGDERPAAPPSTAPPSTTPGDPAASDARPSWQFDAAALADASGFTFDDAAALAQLWNVDPFTTKVVVGEGLRSGAVPGVATLLDTPTDGEVGAEVLAFVGNAYWDAGYDLVHAEELGSRWGTEVLDTKVLVGVRLVAGGSTDDAP